MSNLDPLPFPSATSDFAVGARPEVLSLLRSLKTRNTLVTVYYDGRDQFILSDIVRIDEAADRMELSLADRSPAARRLLASPSLYCVGVLGGIRIHFTLEAPQSSGPTSFSARIPSTVMRIQRRNAFRVPTPAARGATLSVAHPDAAELRVPLKLLELSIGGLGAYAPVQAIRVQTGIVLEDARLTLPEAPAIAVRLEVRHVIEGSRGQIRIGCRFIDLAGPAGALLQRYVNQLERQNLSRRSA